MQEKTCDAKILERYMRGLWIMLAVILDRCVLDVFCCAIYYAEHNKHDPKKPKWWHWKDKRSVKQPVQFGVLERI